MATVLSRTGPICQATSTAGQLVDVRHDIRPDSGAETSGILQPDKARQIVCDSSILIIGESRPWPGNALLH